METSPTHQKVLRAKRTVLAATLLALLPLLAGLSFGIALAYKAFHIQEPGPTTAGQEEHTTAQTHEATSTTREQIEPRNTPIAVSVGNIASSTPDPETTQVNPTSSTPPTTSTTTNTPTASTTQPRVSSITLEVLGATHHADVPEHTSVYGLLTMLRDTDNITFETKPFGSLGYYVTSLNGISENPWGRKFWIYYINGAKAQVGISQYQLKPGDTISWKLEDQE